jgi:hypothetical protein
VQLLPAAPDAAHQVGRLEDGQVLGSALPGHVEAPAQLAQRLAALLAQQVEQVTPMRIGECLEYLVHTLSYAGNRLHVKPTPSSCRGRTRQRIERRWHLGSPDWRS